MLLCRSRTYDCPITSPGALPLRYGISWVNGLAPSLKNPNGLRPPRVCCSSVVKHANYNQTVFGSTRLLPDSTPKNKSPLQSTSSPGRFSLALQLPGKSALGTRLCSNDGLMMGGPMDYFRVQACLIFKASLSAKFLL